MQWVKDNHKTGNVKQTLSFVLQKISKYILIVYYPKENGQAQPFN